MAETSNIIEIDSLELTSADKELFEKMHEVHKAMIANPEAPAADDTHLPFSDDHLTEKFKFSASQIAEMKKIYASGDKDAPKKEVNTKKTVLCGCGCGCCYYSCCGCGSGCGCGPCCCRGCCGSCGDNPGEIIVSILQKDIFGAGASFYKLPTIVAESTDAEIHSIFLTISSILKNKGVTMYAVALFGWLALRMEANYLHTTIPPIIAKMIELNNAGKFVKIQFRVNIGHPESKPTIILNP